jgi:hypothetical protein
MPHAGHQIRRLPWPQGARRVSFDLENACALEHIGALVPAVQVRPRPRSGGELDDIEAPFLTLQPYELRGEQGG